MKPLDLGLVLADHRGDVADGVAQVDKHGNRTGHRLSVAAVEHGLERAERVLLGLPTSAAFVLGQ